MVSSHTHHTHNSHIAHHTHVSHKLSPDHTHTVEITIVGADWCGSVSNNITNTSSWSSRPFIAVHLFRTLEHYLH